jgi:uncharacterized protein
MLKIELFENPRGGEFVIQKNGNRMGEMSYTNMGDGKITIDHTFVESPFRGQHLGRGLVEAGIEFARENNLKIVPLCPFVKSEFDKNSDYTDVLAD